MLCGFEPAVAASTDGSASWSTSRAPSRRARCGREDRVNILWFPLFKQQEEGEEREAATKPSRKTRTERGGGVPAHGGSVAATMAPGSSPSSPSWRRRRRELLRLRRRGLCDANPGTHWAAPRTTVMGMRDAWCRCCYSRVGCRQLLVRIRWVPATAVLPVFELFFFFLTPRYEDLRLRINDERTRVGLHRVCWTTGCSGFMPAVGQVN
jgi:hypothetical protein